MHPTALPIITLKLSNDGEESLSLPSFELNPIELNPIELNPNNSIDIMPNIKPSKHKKKTKKLSNIKASKHTEKTKNKSNKKKKKRKKLRRANTMDPVSSDFKMNVIEKRSITPGHSPLMGPLGSPSLAIHNKQLKLRLFGVKAKLKLTNTESTDPPKKIIAAKMKLKGLKKFTIDIEKTANKLYSAQMKRSKLSNIFCDKLMDINIENKEDKFGIFLNNMGKMYEILDGEHVKYMRNVQNELIDPLSGFNNFGAINQCIEVKLKLNAKKGEYDMSMKEENKLKNTQKHKGNINLATLHTARVKTKSKLQELDLLRSAFLSNISLMEREKLNLISSMKRYISSYDSYCKILKHKLDETHCKMYETEEEEQKDEKSMSISMICTDEEKQKDLEEYHEKRFFSLYEIVEMVTSPQGRGTQDQNVLLYTYCLYTSRDELLKVIFNRLSSTSDDNIVQIKVISLLKMWLKTENDFKNDDVDNNDNNNNNKKRDGLSPFALRFCKELMMNTQDSESLQILAKPIIFQISMPSMDETRYRLLSYADAPIPRIPKGIETAKELNLNKMDPTEVARQICLSEYDIFKKIKPAEFLRLNTSSKHKKMKLKICDAHNLKEEVLQIQLKEMKKTQSLNEEKESVHPNIDKMIDWFNRLMVWTQTEILCQRDLSLRAKALSNLLKICDKLEQYNNISSLCAIRTGLCCASIHRLKKTWDCIPKKSKEIKNKIDYIFKLGNNQKNLRDRISVISQPAIPHIGIFMSDLVFIHDGNLTFSKDDNKENKINWLKMKLLTDRINWMSMFQQTPFIFQSVPIITQYLQSKMKIIPEEFLYKLSREIEHS